MEAAFSSDGSLFAATSHSTFKVWSTSPWTEWAHSYRAKQDWHIASLAFAPHGRTLAVGIHDGVLLWDAGQMKQQTLLPQADGVCAVAFSSDGETLAAASSTGQVKLWDTEQKRELYTLRGTNTNVRALRFSPDGQLLADANGFSALKLWDVATGQQLAERKGTSQGNSTTGLAFTLDGELLLVTDPAHGIIKAWDVAALRSG
jgi:WD40 repeat protein